MGDRMNLLALALILTTWINLGTSNGFTFEISPTMNKDNHGLTRNVCQTTECKGYAVVIKWRANCEAESMVDIEDRYYDPKGELMKVEPGDEVERFAKPDSFAEKALKQWCGEKAD
jgi:hypothetical protein